MVVRHDTHRHCLTHCHITCGNAGLAQVFIQAAQATTENARQVHRGASGHDMQVRACTIAQLLDTSIEREAGQGRAARALKMCAVAYSYVL
jgi:hypothetical protein